MAAQYFVADDQRRGALSWQEVWNLARTGSLGEHTLILLPGASFWRRACEIEPLQRLLLEIRESEPRLSELADPNPCVQSTTSLDLAGPYSRFLARLIDWIIFFPLSMILIAKVPSILAVLPVGSFGMWSVYLYVVYAYIGQIALTWLIVQLMLALFMTFVGTTVGKALLGIKVGNLHNQTPLWFHLKRELKIWVLVLCLGFHTAALFQIGRQYVLLRFGQPAIHDGMSARVEGRPSPFRFLLVACTVAGLVGLLAAVSLG